MRRLASVLILLLLLLALIPHSSAQETPPNIREAAISHYNSVFPGAGRPDGWRHVGPFTASDSALGCTLTAGTALASPVSAYQVFLTYDGQEYSYFISGDASIVVPCDVKFPGMGTGTTGASACNASPIAGDVNLFSQPNNTSTVIGTVRQGATVQVYGRSTDSQWYNLPATSGTAATGWAHTSTLQLTGNCATVPVTDTASTASCTGTAGQGTINVFAQPVNTSTVVGTVPQGSTTQVYGRSADSQWYNVQTVGVSTAPNGWVNTSTLQLTGNCASLPVMSGSSTTTSTTGCTISSPQGNVRQSPSTSASIVGSLTAGISATAVGRTADSSWYQIQFTNASGTSVSGWIADVASTTSGSGCAALPVTGTATADFGGCPADFSGYLAPRLSVGARGRVQSNNNVPNNVRSQPSTTSPIVFEMRPSSEFDVIGGPQCGNGIVWWNVSQNGQSGWTAESNTRDSNNYYVELAAPAAPTGAQYATPANARITSGFILSGKFGLLDQLYGEGLPINWTGDLAWSPDSRRIAIVSVGAIRIFDISTKTNADPALEAALADTPGMEPTAIAYSPDGGFLAVGYTTGNLRLALLGTGGTGTALPGMAAHVNTQISDLAFSPDGRYLLSTSGFVLASGTGSPAAPDFSVRVWDLDTLNVRTGEMQQVLEVALDVAPLDVAWTVSGTPVVITTDDVRAYNLSGGETYRQTRARETVGEVIAADPSWSTTNPNNQNLILYTDGTSVLLADVTAAGQAPQSVALLNNDVDLSGVAGLGPQQAGFDTPVLVVAADHPTVPELQGIALFTTAAQTSVMGFPLQYVRSMEFSPDGMYLAVLTDNTVVPQSGIAPGLWLFGATQ